MGRKALPVLIALFLAALWGAGLGVLHLRGNAWFLDRVEGTLVDLRTLIRGPTTKPEHITIVAIDDEVAKDEGYPLRRATLSRLIKEIERFEPTVIAVDLLLVDANDPTEDRMLAQTLDKIASAIAAAAVFSGGKQWMPPQAAGPLHRIPSAERFLLPLPLFSDVANVGVVNMATDQAGTPRFAPLLFRSGDQLADSLPLLVAAMAAGVDPELEPNRVILGTRLIPTDLGYMLPLSFYGPRGSIPTISAATVLAGKVDAKQIRDHIVVIGVTVTGAGDVFPTPFDPVLPGVEVVATAISHLTTGDGLVRDQRTRLVDAITAVLLPMALISLIAWRRSAIGMAVVLAVLLAWVGVNLVLFSNGVWLSVALPLAAVAPPTVLFGAAQLWRDRNRASYFSEQSQLLQKVHAPGLAAWLAKHEDFLAKPVRVDAAVVFIDLSGFTGLSETMGPNATRELLNEFHLLIDEDVTLSGGIVSSFMGDGAMLLFGLPEPTTDDATNAANCCVRLSKRIGEWLASLPASTASRLGHKIGAHFGTVVASRLGGETHQHVAATGDTVNVANRLMEVAAAHGTAMAISAKLLKAAGEGSEVFTSGFLQGPIETKLRGRTGPLTVWLWHHTEITS